MRSRPTRTVNISTTPTNIRDTTALPVTYSIIRYAGGASLIVIGPAASFAFSEGASVDPDTDYVLKDQSLLFYARTDTGTADLMITDYEA